MQWLAVYNDNTHLMQYERIIENKQEILDWWIVEESIPQPIVLSKENKYQDIDRNRLTHFAILNEVNKPILVVEFERPTQKFIYRRRTFMDMQGNVKGVVYLVGWHENIKGQNIKVINYIYPNGKIILAGAKDDLELLECEI